MFERFRNLFRRKPGMIGIPPSARQVSADSTRHALDFSRRYAEPMDYHVTQRMTELGIPGNQIGYVDPDHGTQWRAFFPGDVKGGGAIGNAIAADAGLFDTDLMARKYGQKIGKRWEKDRLRDRLDQVIAHEYTEASGLTHE